MKCYLRTNSRVETFDVFKAKHKVNLRKRGYSPKFINHFTDQVKFLDCSFELSKKKVTKKLQKLPFVTRFTPSASSAIKLLINIGLLSKNYINSNTQGFPAPCFVTEPIKTLEPILLNLN